MVAQKKKKKRHATESQKNNLEAKMGPKSPYFERKKNLNLPKFKLQVPAGHQNKVGILMFFYSPL
jgi:hypothetical protein